MSLHIMKSDHRKKEKIVSRYLQEIREIAKAGLSRRSCFGQGSQPGVHACRLCEEMQ